MEEESNQEEIRSVEEESHGVEVDLDFVGTEIVDPRRESLENNIKKVENSQENSLQLKKDEVSLNSQDEDIESFQAVAKRVIEAKLAPRGVDTVSKVMVILQTGKELGFPPMMSLNNIHVIEGRPTIGVHLVGALLKRVGIDYYTLKDYEPVEKWETKEGGERKLLGITDYVTTIRFLKKLSTGQVVNEDVSFSFKDAVSAGLSTKSNWKNYPKQMTWNRALVLGARRVAPDALMGMYETSELADVHNVPYQLED